MMQVSGRGRDQGKRGEGTTYYCYVSNMKRRRSGAKSSQRLYVVTDQRVATVVLVSNAAREQVVPWLPLRCQGLLCYLTRGQAHLSVKKRKTVE
jgi:hypothetical protein